MIYHWDKDNYLLSESTSIKPVSWRGLIKDNERNICMKYLSNEFPIKLARVFRAYGPWENSKLIIKILDSIRNNEPVPLGGNEFKRDFIYIEDLISVFLLMADKNIPNGTELNLSSMTSYGPLDILNTIEGIIGREISKDFDGYKMNDYDRGNFIGDNRKTRKVLKWEPKFTLVDGLEKQISWYEKYYKCKLK